MTSAGDFHRKVLRAAGATIIERATRIEIDTSIILPFAQPDLSIDP
ncbi:hypothetical protein [Amaricoccus macauensis]